MQTPDRYVNKRLDHLGMVAGVCKEIGLAAYLDRLVGETKHYVKCDENASYSPNPVRRCQEKGAMMTARRAS